MKKPEIKLVITDWSGVVSNDMLPVYECNMRLLEEYGGKRISFEEWRKYTSVNAAGFLRKYGIPNVDEDRTFRDYKKYFSELMQDGEQWLPFLIDFAKQGLINLKERNIMLAVLSSHPEANLTEEIKRYDVDRFFKIIKANSGFKADGLVEICDTLRVQRQQALFLEDTVDGIEAGKQARTKTAGVCTGYHDKERLKAAKPDYLLDDLRGLKYVFEGV